MSHSRVLNYDQARLETMTVGLTCDDEEIGMSAENVLARVAVYRCFGSGEVLYIGSTKEIWSRLRSHSDTLWWLTVDSITLEWYASESDARRAEAAAIAAELPRYNVRGTGRSQSGRLSFAPPPAISIPPLPDRTKWADEARAVLASALAQGPARPRDVYQALADAGYRPAYAVMMRWLKAGVEQGDFVRLRYGLYRAAGHGTGEERDAETAGTAGAAATE